MKPVPAILALEPRQHDLATKMLKEALSIQQKLEAGDKQRDIGELEIGRILSMAYDGSWTQILYGKTVGEWTQEHFRTHGGEAITANKALNLAKAWRTIHKFPEVERAMNEGPRQFSRTAAWYCCAHAIISKIRERAVEKFLETNSAKADEAGAHGEKAANDWIFHRLKTKTATDIRNDYYATKDEIEKRGSKPGKQWKKFDRAIEAEVFDRFHEVLGEICQTLDDDEAKDPNRMSLTQKLERLLEWSDDSLEALKALRLGDRGPVESLLERVGRAG